MSTASTPRELTPPRTYAVASPIGVPSATEEATITFADVTRILKQRKLLIIVTSIVLYILVVAVTVLTLLFAPTFTSEAILELEPPDSGEILMPMPGGNVNTQYMEQLLATEASKIKNMQLMLEVVGRAEIKQTEYFRWYDSNVMEAAVGLSDDLSVGPMLGTRLIRVALSCKNKNEARDIVQTVVDRYMNQHTDAAQEEMLSKSESLNETLADLSAELERKRGEIRRLRENSNLPAMEMRRQEAREHVVQLQLRLNEMDAALASLQAQKNIFEGMDPALIPLTAEQELLVESDPMLRYWRSQVENLDVELVAMAERLGPNHRDVAMLQQRRQGFYEKEVAKREEMVVKVRTRQIELLDQQTAQTRSMHMRLQEQVESVKAEERDLDRNLLQYQEMLTDEERLSEQIGEVQSRLTEARYVMRNKTLVRMHLRQAPQVAIKPTRPNLKIYLPAGFLLAIAGGVGLAFLRELTDQAVRTPVDVARFCRLSVLGCIPELGDEEADVENIEDAVRLAPQSLIAEAFRRTRTNLQFSGPVESQRTLLITSPSPGDGKTATAVNLATTMAHNNLRVLLVDCNFRRPGLKNIYPNARAEGLSNLLIGEGTLDNYVAKTDIGGLDVLFTGPMPPTPAELLGSERMNRLLKDASEKYDRVILDGPPTLLISDSTVMAQLVDGVILVTRADENTRGTLKRARDQLDGINARVIGAVINGVKIRAGGYFKKQYREFYDYVSDETIPAMLPSTTNDSDDDEQT